MNGNRIKNLERVYCGNPYVGTRDPDRLPLGIVRSQQLLPLLPDLTHRKSENSYTATMENSLPER